ncbi:hypothetical protein LRP67_08790 [Nocardioides sp. cx-169]|uniref:FtsX-like permease family protein n=1 Tax=Nocardioides sp. cx-169 TaxID=2899080 RepID=UPI001E2D4A1E|nr:FtsX-like permease family protein [Nocardioides sp. cx-169]MCD4534175.1 hypothetical protein [Nocardioides sp. cx-169]
MSRLARWRPALRIAWRDLLQHPLRTVVVTVLVALPVAVAVVVSTVTTTVDYYSPNSVTAEYGTADASLEVTRHPRVRVTPGDRGRYVEYDVAPKARREKRDPAAVDVATTLLPPGARVSRIGEVPVSLAVGGRLSASVLDLDDPLTRGLAALESGRAPRAAHEAAVGRLLADELGLLEDDGALKDGATLELADGELDLVGVLAPRPDRYYADVAVVVAPARVGSRPDEGGTLRYLVDLPVLSSDESRALQRELAAHGISAWMRDATEHPDAWGLEEPLPTPVEPAAAAAAALVIGLGLVEVLVLVGSAFAVGARRQTRTLGLVMASGGTPSDVRRTVLAQGVWIGVAAAVLGTGAGLGVLLPARGLIESIAGQEIHVYSLSAGTILAVALLGVASAVAAAAIPAWGVGRLTAAEALDGHIASGTRRIRGARLRTPALWLVGSGLAGLVLCGWWTSRAFTMDPATGSLVPVVLGALSALVLLAGALLLVPFLVDWLGAGARRGWLPWRLAVRDVARHRGRTTAAVLGIGIVVTGAVFAGFGVSANAALQERDQPTLPPDTAYVYLDGQPRDPSTVARVEAAAVDVVGSGEIVTVDDVRFGTRRVTDPSHGSFMVVDPEFLEVMGLADAVPDLLAGKALVTVPRTIRQGQVRMVAGPRNDRALDERLPAVRIRPAFTEMPGSVWLSRDTASALGLRAVPSQAFLHADRTIDQDDVERLRYYGIDASIERSSGAVSPRLVLGGAVGVLLATCMVVGMVVALSASEGRADAATLAAVGAPAWTRRAMSAGQALVIGCLGAGVGLLLGSAVGASLLQLVGTAGTPVPWVGLAVVVVGVPLLSAAVGWLVTPTRLALTRRTG